MEIGAQHVQRYDLSSAHGIDVCFKMQGNGKVVLSMDALFGLPRKKAAGISHRQALHGAIFFQDQSSVDSFVSNFHEARYSHNKVTVSIRSCHSTRFQYHSTAGVGV